MTPVVRCQLDGGGAVELPVAGTLVALACATVGITGTVVGLAVFLRRVRQQA
jgi:hypothetical protein